MLQHLFSPSGATSLFHTCWHIGSKIQISESDLHAWLQFFFRGVHICVRFFVAEAQAVNANGFPAPEHEFGMVNPLAKVSIMIGKTSVT